MIWKGIKYGVIGVVACVVFGAVFFGGDLVSYVRSSAKSVQTVVKDSVPVEFELQRARDLVEHIVPELHANIRLIAHEEVEIAALSDDIESSEQEMGEERDRVARMRDELAGQQVHYTFSNRRYTRDQVKQELSRRFERYRESDVILAGKKRLLETRQRSLQAAMERLDRTRSEKTRLEQQIEALAGQHRLIQAASVGSRINLDGSKLAESQKLIRQIKKRLDVAERVLAHDARFVEGIPLDVINEHDLLTEFDEYFNEDAGTSDRVADAGQALGSEADDHAIFVPTPVP